MSDTIITVENLCKKYTIGHQKQARYETFRESLSHMGRGMLQRLRYPLSPNKENVDLEEFWALKDVNFEIKQGDRVGIIGRNGAGKSTLLKILSRITEPTSGRVSIKGRIASLLEVGTGFHPELTGRENVFLNGAILGMSRVEIKKKFDEIVDFAEIEKFLDTPVKRYSSGMYVRLAFAVAAHLEPEILLVDEVLAVGDAEFQKKCLGKMEDVGKEGRTVIFVSHNMRLITQLCNVAIWLNQGTIFKEGNATSIVSQYFSISDHNENKKKKIPDLLHNHAARGLKFTKIYLSNSKGKQTNVINFKEILRLFFHFNVYKKMGEIRIGIAIRSIEGILISVIQQTDEINSTQTIFPIGDHSINVSINLPLYPGEYTISLFAKECPGYWGSNHSSLDYVENIITFVIRSSSDQKYNLFNIKESYHKFLLLPETKWKLCKNKML